MLRNLSRVLVLMLPVLFALGCAGAGSVTPAPTSEPTAAWPATIEVLEAQIQELQELPAEPTPEIYGLWMTETDDPARTNEILVFTADSMYHLDTFEPAAPAQGPFARETYYEVVEHDAGSRHMTVRIQWIRYNGEFVGFDSPTALLAYQVEDDVLRLAMASFDEGQYPEELDPTEYYRR